METPSNDKSTLMMVQDLMFEQMKRLSEPAADLEKEIKRSQALSTAGTVIINTCKAQIDAVRVDMAQKKTDQEGKQKGTASIHKLPDPKKTKQLGNG